MLWVYNEYVFLKDTELNKLIIYTLMDCVILNLKN
jgi:hypothetical protein